MTEEVDHSLLRDVIAADTATKRADAADAAVAAAVERSDESLMQGKELSDYVHRIAGSVSACARTIFEVQDAQKLIVKRLDDQDRMLEENTAATKEISENTRPLVGFMTDLTAGTHFFCRIALGVRFLLKEVIEPYWKPVAVLGVVVWGILHGQMPDWPALMAKLSGK